MEYLIEYLAALSIVDKKLDELKEEYGDLPEKVKQSQLNYNKYAHLVKETETILKDVKDFAVNSKFTIEELKNKEEKLSKKQFKVRNNKEFDAITKEIEHIRNEHSRIINELRTIGVKEENLVNMLEQQKVEADEAKKEYELIEEELEFISNDQTDEVKVLNKKRKKIVAKTDKAGLAEYERIRNSLKDAVVLVKKNSCTGCFSSVPPQKIVEMRNNLDQIYHCENCGRIIFPEEVNVDEEVENL